jgi:hypothetical protein
MTLSESHKVSCSDILDAPGVYLSSRYLVGRYQFAKQGRRPFIDLVVVGCHVASINAVAAVAM